MVNDNKNAPADWLSLENKFLEVSREMYSKWSKVFQAVHACDRLKTISPQDCMAKMDRALKEARDLEELNKRYVRIIEEMDNLLRSK